MGTKAKPLAAYRRRLCCLNASHTRAPRSTLVLLGLSGGAGRSCRKDKRTRALALRAPIGSILPHCPIFGGRLHGKIPSHESAAGFPQACLPYARLKNNMNSYSASSRASNLAADRCPAPPRSNMASSASARNRPRTVRAFSVPRATQTAERCRTHQRWRGGACFRHDKQSEGGEAICACLQ
jgi:hypothetical protein